MALLRILVLFVLGVVAMESAGPRITYDFDYGRHLAALDDTPDHRPLGGRIGGCENPDAHVHPHPHDITEQKGDSDSDSDSDRERDSDTDDDDDRRSGRATTSSQCGVCGGDHADTEHPGHRAHGHAHEHRRRGRMHSRHHGYHGYHHSKPYRFRVGMDMPRTGYLYLNEAGRLEGFLIDLIANVCRTAGKICHPVLDLQDRCWKSSTDSPGTGLVSGWYDGCVGLFPTPEKHNSFDFSDPFSRNPTLALHFAVNRVPSDPTFLGRKRLGFVRGFPMDASCIRRLAIFRGTFEAVQFETMQQLGKALMTNQIDAFPWNANFSMAQLPMEQAGPTFSCATQGLSLMARKGDHLITWWNEAYQKLVQEGAYEALCEKAREQPGPKGRVYCLEE